MRTFKKNAIFKNRYEEEFIKDNEKFDFKLHHTDIDTKDYPIVLINGVDVKSDKFYTTLISGVEDGRSKVKIDKYNNISGNFIDVIKVDKNFDLFLHEFDSEVEQNKFIEQESKLKEGI